MLWRGILCLALLGCITVSAQETKKGDAKAADKPVPDAPQTEFDKKLVEWKAVITKLEDIRAAWKIAMPDERKKLEQDFKTELAKGEEMLPMMIKAAEDAFANEKDAKQAAGEFMAAVANTSGGESDYELTARLTQKLLEGGFEAKGLNDLGGRAAFATMDLDRAKRYFQAAQDKGALTEVGKRDLGEIDAYRKYWEREQELRAAEEKAEGNDKLPRVELKTTKGTIVVELFENEAPNTVANFISLVEKADKPYYNGTPFHRVLADFMAQGGDPTGTGTGGPGYHIKCECDSKDARMHFRGSLSMAHAGKDTGGSQFFLTFRPTSHLNNKHTVFGRVVEGMDVLAKLQRRDPGDPNAPAADKIIEAKVLNKRNHEYKPETIPDKK